LRNESPTGDGSRRAVGCTRPRNQRVADVRPATFAKQPHAHGLEIAARRDEAEGDVADGVLREHAYAAAAGRGLCRHQRQEGDPDAAEQSPRATRMSSVVNWQVTGKAPGSPLRASSHTGGGRRSLRCTHGRASPKARAGARHGEVDVARRQGKVDLNAWVATGEFSDVGSHQFVEVGRAADAYAAARRQPDGSWKYVIDLPKGASGGA